MLFRIVLLCPNGLKLNIGYAYIFVVGKRTASLKRRKLLIGSMISLPIGIILWMVLAPVLCGLGIGSYETGWWIFKETHYYTTPLYWLGIAIGIIGMITVIGGVSGIVIGGALEILDRKRERLAGQKPRMSIEEEKRKIYTRLVLIGISLFIIGLFCIFYSETPYGLEYLRRYPFRDVGIIFSVLGILITVVGYALPLWKK